MNAAQPTGERLALAGRRVAVIGAGIAGLACARALADAGWSVVVHEKGRTVGGRLATRTSPQGPYDHGAQYFTVQSAALQAAVDGWVAAGHVLPWEGRLIALSSGRVIERSLSAQRFVAVPGMQAIAEHLALDLPVHLLTPIEQILRTAQGWRLVDSAGGAVGEAAYDAVCIALPSQQAAVLLRGVSVMAERAASVQWEPCWATLLALSRPSGLDFDGAFVNDDPILGWVSRDSAKPGRPKVAGVSERWVLHARPRWSRDYLDMPEEEVTHWMQRAFIARLGRPLVLHGASAMLWSSATPVNPLAESFLWDERLRIGVAGDWCGGPRVEGAWLSGRALAARLMAQT